MHWECQRIENLKKSHLMGSVGQKLNYSTTPGLIISWSWVSSPSGPTKFSLLFNLLNHIFIEPRFFILQNCRNFVTEKFKINAKTGLFVHITIKN